MNKLSMLISSFLLIASFIKAQNIEVIYDFEKGDFVTPIPPVRNGDYVTIVIKDVNTFRYNVSIEGKRVDYVTEVPSELQMLFRLPKEELSEEVDEADKSVNAIREEVEKFRAISKAASAGDFKNAMDSLVESCEEYIELTKRVARVKYNRTALINITKQPYNKHTELYNNAAPYLMEEATMQGYYDKFIERYAEVERLYARALDLTTSGTQLNNKMKGATEAVHDAHDAIDEESFFNLIHDVLILKKSIENKETFRVISPPIQMDGDYVEIVVSIIPSPVSDLMPFEEAKEIMMMIPGYKGWKADFSVGPTMSFGDGALDDKPYIDPTGNLLMLNNNENAIRPSIAAMMHFYQRRSQDVAFGGMFGIGAGFKSIDDADLSVYLGGGLVLGKTRKIMLSGGLSYLRVSRVLKEQYVVGTTVLPQDTDVSTLVEKVFRQSFFFSVSYNLTNRVEVN